MKLVLGSVLAFVLAVPLAGQSTGEADPSLPSPGLRLHQPRENIAPADLDIYSAYQEAQQLEAEIVQMFREVRAAELTMVQRQTLKRSLESILIPLSKRAEVDRAVLTAKATSAKDVERYQAELSVVMQETDAIISNARDLLESLEEKQAPQASTRLETARQTTEPMEAQQEQNEPQQAQESPAAEDSGEMSEQWQKEQRERLEQQAKEELEKTAFHLEKALEEIQAARMEVTKEQHKARVVLEEEAKKPAKAAESAQAIAARGKLENLARLKVKIDTAENAVKVIVEKVKAMENISNVDLKRAEDAMEALREALAKVKVTDASAKKEAQAATNEKTAKAVRHMEAARSSLASASDAIRSLHALTSGGGGGDGGRIAQIQAMDRLAAAASGAWLDLTRQMRGEALEAVPNETPPAERPELWAGIEELERSPSARKFSTSTPRDVWIFIGDWYVLSRYNNAGRANLEKVYPPESIVDLNAQYLSEDGKTLRWEYESYPPPMVAPYGWESWRIYYFYTELTFEEETEAWLAIGSDDRSDLWINDLPVWHSANRHKGWHPAEGFRKVVFNAGRNQLLLRLENGQQGLGFSIFLNLTQP